MFIFKIWNIIFPQASENENTGFNISRGKYAFKALPEPACNVNRQTINGSCWPRRSPAILQSCYCRLHVSWHKEGLPLPPTHSRPCLLTKKVLVLNTRSPLSFHCWDGQQKIVVPPCSCWNQMLQTDGKMLCIAREVFPQTMVPLYYNLSADGGEKACRCFVSRQRKW